ncbi:MAG: 2-C-methyl-D-erythritol 2,4-cyclodiphosphate synthase [candidate division Zixibacteria bacterium]|nr:2-C-methyl-D-erythritol 2,4-cyclodiphosphate synthase [candidate division Zixibacteria bacterium]
MRIGNGYDVHRLVTGRKLILGGVEIEFEKGLDGHSDADVLTHAIMDALLGAATLGDIGQHFPPSDEKYKNADSIELLKEVVSLLKTVGYTEIINIDSTVIAEKPKMVPYINEMRKNISDAIGIEINQINIKATTTEKLGFTGREEGIAALAVCLISKS